MVFTISSFICSENECTVNLFQLKIKIFFLSSYSRQISKQFFLKAYQNKIYTAESIWQTNTSKNNAKIGSQKFHKYFVFFHIAYSLHVFTVQVFLTRVWQISMNFLFLFNFSRLFCVKAVDFIHS